MKVSIIIPVYKVSAYIERCIHSVMNQTYHNIECILVNDASRDDSIAIAEHLIADYKGPVQFQIISLEKNKGISAARNTGADAATGDYLYFFDSDDEITPDCIEKLARPILNDPSIEMVEGCFVQINKDCNNVISEHPFSRPQLEFTTRKAVREFYYSRRYENKLAWNKLVNRDFFLKNKIYFKEGLPGEDNFWHFHYNKYLSHLYIIPDITYKYIKRPNSVTTSKSKDFRTDFGNVYAEIAKNLTPNEEAKEVQHFLKGFCLFYIGGPTTSTYKQVACIFLNVLKANHCIKDWLFLKFVVLISKFKPAKKIIKNFGERLKKKKNKK